VLHYPIYNKSNRAQGVTDFSSVGARPDLHSEQAPRSLCFALASWFAYVLRIAKLAQKENDNRNFSKTEQNREKKQTKT